MTCTDREASGAPRALSRRVELGLVLVVVLLSAVLRTYRLTDQSIWYDEAFDVLLAQRSPAFIVAQAAKDTMPPLHYLLLHLWMCLGKAEFVVRLYPVFMGVLGTAALYPIARRLVGPWARLGALSLLAASPFQIYYAREVRMYSQLLFLSLIFAVCLLRCRGDGGDGAPDPARARLGDWLALVLFGTLSVYTHTFGFLVPLVLGLLALLRARKRDPVVFRRLLVSGIVIGVLALPWALWVLPQQAGRVVRAFWVQRPSPVAPLSTVQMLLFGYTIPLAWAPVALFVTLALAAIAFYQVALRRCWVGVVLVAWLTVPIALVWIVSQWVPVYLDRLFIASAPAFYLLIAWSLARMPRPLRWALAGLLACVLCVSLGHYYFDRAYHKPPMRDAARYVADRVRPGDAVLHTGDSSFLTFQFYQPGLTQFLASGDPDHSAGSARATSLDLLGFAGVPYGRVSAQYDRLWVVTALDHSVAFQAGVVEQLLDQRTVVWSTSVGDIWIRLLVPKA